MTAFLVIPYDIPISKAENKEKGKPMRIVCSGQHGQFVDATYMMVRPDGQDGMQCCDEHALPLIADGWNPTPITPEYARQMTGAFVALAAEPLATTPDVWGTTSQPRHKRR